MNFRGLISVTVISIISLASGCQAPASDLVPTTGFLVDQTDTVHPSVQPSSPATPSAEQIAETVPIVRVTPATPTTPEPVQEETTEVGIMHDNLINTHLEASAPFEGLVYLNPVWSNDGQRLAYRKDTSAIWVVNTDTWDNPREILSVSRIRELGDSDSILNVNNMAWSPDDEALAFTLLNPTKHISGFAIYEFAQDEIGLVSRDIGELFDWGVNGVLTCSPFEGCFLTDVVSNQQQGIGNMVSPFFISDNEVIFRQDDGLVVIKHLGTGQEEVVSNLRMRKNRIGSYTFPMPSPDGRYIASVNDSRFHPQLEIYDRINQQLIAVPEIEGLGFWSLISWSPDSRRLAFVFEGTIWILSLDL